MDYHSSAVFLRCLRVLEGHISYSWWDIRNVQIPISPQDRAPNWPVPVTVGMFGSLESCTQSQTPKVMILTKMAPSRHPIPEIAKAENDDSYGDSERSWPSLTAPRPYHGGGGDLHQTADRICRG